MTHTLHRVGDRESLERDYVVYMLAAKGINDEGSAAKLKKFLDICAQNNPVNIGCLYPDPELGGRGYLRGQTFEETKDSVIDYTSAHAVFVDKEMVKKVLRELREADLGLSVVVSGIFDEVFECCREAGLTPHTVNMALGIWGKTEVLPPRKILDVVTMCGHGMVSKYLVDALVKRVRKRRITAEEAAKTLGANCVCGVFNPVRAAGLIRELAAK